MKTARGLRGVSTLAALCVTMVVPLPAQTEDQLTAEEIVARQQQAFLYAGDDFRAEVSMRLVDKEGNERRRKLTMLRIDTSGEASQKYYMYFQEPADVRATAFLVWKYADKDDDRWLFIPAIKLVTRVAAKDAQSSFVGSDFSYEDISGRDLGADTHTLMREEAREGKDCYVIESIPQSASAFARKLAWIDKTTFLPIREEYYDVQDELSKVFNADEVTEVGGHPTVMRRTMTDVKREHHTEVVFENVAYDTGLDESLFSDRYLQKPPAQWIQ
jgi:outer membrane lipoprotein-sorting protein